MCGDICPVSPYFPCKRPDLPLNTQNALKSKKNGQIGLVVPFFRHALLAKVPFAMLRHGDIILYINARKGPGLVCAA